MAALLCVFAAGCKKEEEIIVPGNEAPPDSTVNDVVLESYINRCYITLLGERPDDAEMAAGKTALRSHNLSMADREAFLDGLMAQPAYVPRVYDIGRANLLNSTDTSDIREEIWLLDFILSDSAYIAFWPLAQTERAKLQDVVDIPADLAAGTIGMQEVYRRLVTNRIYDDINMGTQNFVISLFQNFLNRYPTEAERVAGEAMVNGFTSQVFLVNGDSKTEFIDIFLHSRDYYEGQVRELYRRYLYHEPTTEAMEELTLSYEANGDYKALQKAVLSNDEFVGL